MALQVDPDQFQLPPELAEGIRGKRVFITGAGKDRGLGQSFALAAGLNGAESVGVHFHNSYEDGLETVDLINSRGGNAFPVQCDVTNPRDVWSIRSYVFEKMGGKPPNLVICNSGLSERGYLLGRVPREVDEETPARRRARVRQAFVNNLSDSQAVIDTKVDGFLAITHLWASEAVHAKEPIRLVFISSRQAVEAGAGVPGYVMANWAVVSLPTILKVNLGKRAAGVTSLSVGYPFVHTGMTEDYADNPKVFGRWQSRMLEAHEAARALMQLLGRDDEELDEQFFQLDVEGEPDDIRISWSGVDFTPSRHELAWSKEKPLRFQG